MSVKNVLVITYWSYKDALIQTYTLPYVRMMQKNLPKGSQLYLLTLEQDHLKIPPLEFDNIKRSLSTESINLFPVNYKKFGIKAMVYWFLLFPRLITLCLRKDISHIHCWCTPAGAIGYLLSKLTGRILILDSYEPHAEAMIENGTWKRKSISFKLLFLLEKLQSNFTKTVISATEGMRYYAKEKYGAVFDKFYVKPACVDMNLFSEKNIKDPELLKALNLSGKLVCVYAGKFGGIYLEQEVFDFFKIASDYWGEKFKILLLTGHTAEDINKYCKRSNLDPSVIVQRFVPHSEVPNHMGLGDFAITPVKTIPTKRFCTPIKNGEYWALGLPVVIPKDISDDSEIIEKNQIGAVLHSFDAKSYVRAVEVIDELLKTNTREDLYKKIRNIAHKYRSFGIAENIYRQIYNKAS